MLLNQQLYTSLTLIASKIKLQSEIALHYLVPAVN